MFRALVAAASVALASAQPVRITINLPIVTHAIDERLYGQTVTGGIWGEAVRNRRFQESNAEGDWRVNDGVLECAGPDCRFRLDAPRNYELSVEVRRPEGVAALLVGSVAVGHEDASWHNVRVRVEGDRAQAWLDSLPLPAGVAAPALLGARGGPAQFRAVAISTPGGRALCSGVPLPARHWYATGPIDAATDGHAFHVVTRDTNAIAAIQQCGIAVRAGDTLRGMLRLRAPAPGLILRLLSGTQVIGSQTLGAATEVPLAIAPSATAPDATLQLLLPRRADLALEEVSLMSDSARAAGGFRPDLLQALAELRPPILRWSAENWKTAAFGVDQFLALAAKLRSQPVVSIPGSMSAQEAEELARYCEPRVKYVERRDKPLVSEWNASSALEAAGGLIGLEGEPGVAMAAPAPPSVIDFDRPWQITPAYAAVHLYRSHYASDVLQMKSDPGPLSAIATRTGDGRRIDVKLVNPAPAAADIEVTLRGDFPILAAGLQILAGDAVRIASGPIERDGFTLRFRLPSRSIGIVALTR